MNDAAGLTTNEKAAWLDPRSFASTLVGLFLRAFGADATRWHAATIEYEVARLLGKPLPPASYDRLMTGIAIVTTNRFYKDLRDFQTLCRVLSGDTAPASTWEPVDAQEIAWGITEAALLGPPEADDPEPFTTEIRRYIGEVTAADGFLNPPDVLRFGLPPSPRPVVDWSDAPEYQGAVAEVQEIKNREIIEMIRDGLARLKAQQDALQPPSSASEDDRDNNPL